MPGATMGARSKVLELDRDWAAVVAAVFGLMFCVGTLTVYSFGVFVRPLHAEFGWSRTQLAGSMAISQYGMAVASPIWGVWVDRFGPRVTLLISIVLQSLLFASLGLLTPHLWHLYLMFAAIPLLAAGSSPMGYSAIIVRRFERHLGLALGLATMGVGLGAAVLPPLGEALISAFGWRVAYAVIGAISLVIGLPATLVATRHVRGPILGGAGGVRAPLLPLLRTRVFLLISTVFFLLGITTVGVLVQFVPMMIDRGFTPMAASQAAAVTGLAALIGRGVVGWVLDRVPAPRVVASVAALAGIAFLLLVYDRSRPASYVVAIFLGGTIGAEVNFIAYLIRSFFAQAVYGRLYGVGFGVYMIGTGTGPLLLGASFDHLGGYAPGLLLFAALAFIAAIFALKIPKPTGIGL